MPAGHAKGVETLQDPTTTGPGAGRRGVSRRPRTAPLAGRGEPCAPNPDAV